MKRSILIASLLQFGYHTDPYMWARYLSFSRHTVTYLCMNENKEHICTEDINVIYLPQQTTNTRNKILFIKHLKRLLNTIHFDILFLLYFPGVSILSFLNKKKLPILLDVRTGTISSNRLISFAKDCLIYFEHFSFEYHSVISEGLRKKLLFPPSSFILPLGAEELDIEPSFTDTDTLNLIYIGTLRFRNIDKTIIGLKKFMDDHPNVSVNYLIIADINAPEYSGIQSLIKAHHLETSIKMNGYVSHDKLADYLKISNIGVCFIPVLPQYDHQPATKAFEYLLAGIPTIATATSSNKQVINDTNGVLIQDSPESFAWGIEQIWRNIHQYDSISIKQSVSRYTWENIVSALEVQMEKMINEYQKNDLKTFENDFVH